VTSTTDTTKAGVEEQSEQPDNPQPQKGEPQPQADEPPPQADEPRSQADEPQPQTDEPRSQTDEPRPRFLRANRLAVLMLAATVVLAALGGWFTVESRHARSSAAAQNRALVDTAATAEVSAAISTSLNRVFSYSYDKPEVTQQAAAEVLRGPALDTYNRLFAQVRELAPQQKIVLTTRVVNIAVQSLTGERAQLLAFLDQSATRADNNSTSTGAAQLSVTAQRQGTGWVIIDLTPR
jgi:Mce-associated membrane protein